MNESTPKLCGLLASVGIAAGLFLAARPALSEDVTPPVSAESGPAGAVLPDDAAGLIVYINPLTGEISPTPVPGTQPMRLSPQIGSALSTSDLGLVATQSQVPGGGVGVNLQGRFQSPLMAVIGADGKVSTMHLGEPAALPADQ